MTGAEQELAAWVVGVTAFLGVGSIALIGFITRFLYICKPNQVLIFSGGANKRAGVEVGYKVIFGGRAWRLPFLEQVDHLDMRTIPIELNTRQAYSKDGIPLNVRAIANVKISANPVYVGNAIERFLGRDPREIHGVARETLEGTLRGVLATLTPEEVNEDRLKFANSLADEVAEDFAKLGLHLDTLKIQHVTDDVEYLESIGRGKIAQVIRDAEIAESNAKNESNQRAAEATARGDVAQQDAEREIVMRRNEQARIAAELKAEVESAQRQAEAAGYQARFEAEHELQVIRRKLEELRLRAEVELPADAERRAAELRARGAAAATLENGKALAQALQLLTETWKEAGPHARDIYLLQQIEGLMGTIVDQLSGLEVGEVNIIDPGDGSGLPNYIASFPSTVTAVLKALRESTGVDVPALLALNPRGDS